jgi:hypothetical protein
MAARGEDISMVVVGSLPVVVGNVGDSERLRAVRGSLYSMAAGGQQLAAGVQSISIQGLEN